MKPSLAAVTISVSLAPGIMGIPAPAASDPPSIRTRSVEQTGSTASCLRQVKEAVLRAGFKRLDIDSNDVEAENGEYATETVCTGSRVVIIVAGPSSRQAGLLRDAIASRL